MSVPHYSLYINGEWVDTGENYEIRSPATEELVATVAKGGVAQVDQAVAAAKAAHEEGTWRRTPPAQRAALLNDVATRLGGRIDELAALQTRENGATIRITGALHIGLSIAQMQYLADQAATYEFETAGPEIGPVPAEGLVRREPLGVVAAIVPWNIPLLVIVWKIAPALAAGNTVVLKPDEHAPLVALELAKEFEAAGLPPGVLNVVTGDGEPTGAHLSGHPDVRKVAFTGSTAVGKSILRQSADTVKRVTLELGGKGPNIILDSADLDTAIDGALFAALANNGQACEAGTRLLIPSSNRDEIISRLVERARTLKVGDPLDPATGVGPIISKVQHQRILDYFAIAETEGAKAVIGGGVPTGPGFDKGYWIEPTIFVGVTNDARIAREEVFGPVLVVLTYDSVEEAIKIANDTDYGLSAGVWGDEDQAIEIARELDAGMVWINDWHVIHPAYPFGGFKQSGLGREGGPHALDEYTEAKFISLNRSPGPEARAFAIVIDPA
ncbi:aldehyde dehydrogenase family protein [Rhodococcus opacus]|uniref:aldehyde dehydrogenase family protein n=1 Tax=Rhodococcus TaxID=1827 RepID=UPI00131FC1A0|nr:MULTISPECIES: aldehyde dehydrogenase family protein [Rhodococcus]MDJ0420111.1 aldehyde dehydrogenase family protein [Rhodococcus opacus]MDV7089048.1 aldehyde dehydrogenase family protein [Rhodococcus opacus]QHE73577.1 Aldehyde dehydrogenase [Rhodococcus sp. WAY2]UNN04637.1 aldehyde dehydrogenase family protein [Rhodococcus opacus]WKN52437.1 aldehyde dehydrogenase family protein [Rhodococcus opacus]